MKKHIWIFFLVGSLAISTLLSLNGQALAGNKPIKIGVIGPMTHISGKHIMDGVSMARNEINQAGGVNIRGQQHPIELIKIDTNELVNVTDAATAVERAITVDKVDFLLGGWKTEAVLAMQDVAMDYKKVMITGGMSIVLSNQVKKNYERYKYWYSVYYVTEDAFKYYFETLKLYRDVVKKELGISEPKVAIVLDKAAWTDPLAKMAPKFIESLGCRVVGVWRPSTVATDVSAELLDIKSKGAQIIWVVSYGPSGLVMCKQWAEYKIPAVIIGSLGEATYSTFWKSTNGNGDYVETAACIARVEITEKTIPFWDKYIKTHGDFPNVFSAYFYDNLHRIKAAVEEAGSLDPDKVAASLEKISYVGASGRYEAWGKDSPFPHFVPVRPGNLLTVGAQWQDGDYKVVWPPSDGSFEGLKFKGVVPAQLPPWMVTYWKKK